MQLCLPREKCQPRSCLISSSVHIRECAVPRFDRIFLYALGFTRSDFVYEERVYRKRYLQCTSNDPQLLRPKSTLYKDLVQR